VTRDRRRRLAALLEYLFKQPRCGRIEMADSTTVIDISKAVTCARSPGGAFATRASPSDRRWFRLRTATRKALRPEIHKMLDLTVPIPAFTSYRSRVFSRMWRAIRIQAPVDAVTGVARSIQHRPVRKNADHLRRRVFSQVHPIRCTSRCDGFALVPGFARISANPRAVGAT